MTINAISNNVELTDEEISIMQDAAQFFVHKGEPVAAELWGDDYKDINSFVYIPYRQRSALASHYGPGADVEALLQADWRVARSLGAVRTFKGALSDNVAFPIHVLRQDGEPITVSIKENWNDDCGNAKPWYLSYVPDAQPCAGTESASLAQFTIEETPKLAETPRASSFRLGDRLDRSALEKISAIVPKDTLPRDELAQWARFKWCEILPGLADMAVPESWCFDGDTQHEPYEILRSYLSYTFHRLQLEDKVAENEGAGLAAFDTGLLHKANLEPIYACFKTASAGSPRRFAGFCRVGVGNLGKSLAMAFNPLPKRASYLSCAEDLLYDTGNVPVVDYEHVLLDNMDRLPRRFLENELSGSVEAQAALLRMDFCDEGARKSVYDDLAEVVESSPALYRKLVCALEAAVGLALRKVERCYGTAIPFYYAAAGTVSLLIPLDLTGDGKPDVALATQRAESGIYLGRTVLTLKMAYNGARLISSLEGSWLSAAVETERRKELQETEVCSEPMLLSA